MKRKYKVAIIVSRIDFGAAELIEFNLVKSLSKLGHDITLVLQFSKEIFDDNMILKNLILKQPAIKVFRLNSENKISPFTRLFKLRSQNFDFIISHNRFGHIYSRFITIFTNTKSILNFHTYFLINKFSLINKIWEKCIKKAHYTTHISYAVKNINNNTFHIPEYRSEVVLNAINLDKKSLDVDENKFSFIKNKKIILSVSRVDPVKGIDNNIDIVSEILKVRDDVIYVVVGQIDYDTQYFNFLKQKIHNLKLDSSVFFIGISDNVYGWMKRSSVLLHFANHEGFGLVLLEALKMSIPIVSSDVGGIREVLKNTQYNPFNLSQIKEAQHKVKYYLDNRISNNYDQLINNFSYKNRALSFQRILNKIYK